MTTPVAFSDPIGGLPADEWDDLAAGRLYSSSGWLRFADADVGGRAVGGALPVKADSDTAAVPVTAVREESNSFYRWRDQLVELGLPAPDPVGLLVGSRRGYQTHLLTANGRCDTGGAGALLEGLRELRSEVAGSAAMPDVAPGPVPCVAMFLDTPDLLALREAGVATLPVVATTDAWMEIPPGGWPEWLRSLPSKGRRDSVKQEAKAFRAAGYELRTRPLTAAHREAAELLAGVQSRHGQDAEVEMLSESLRRQGEAMGDVAQVLFCGRPGEPAVGFSLYYIYGDTLSIRAVGLDYDRLADAAEYFNLCYYEPVRIAGEHNLRRLHPGIAAPGVKAMRGARLSPLWLLDLSEDSVLLGHDEEIRAINAAHLRQLQETSPAVAKALDLDAYAPFC